MDTSINSSAPEFFRCHRLAATITPHQCRLNRERCETLMQQIDLRDLALEEMRAPCIHCPQAPQVDAGRVRLFTIPQVVKGHALREPAAEALPWEHPFTAQPDEYSQTVLTSNFWVPPCDL